MAEDQVSSIWNQLKAQLESDIGEGQPQQALAYTQSFVVRKRSSVGRKGTSELVFSAALVFADLLCVTEAGSLLAWFIEDGAGEGYSFFMEKHGDSSVLFSYCDIQHIYDLLDDIPEETKYPIISKIYQPLQLAIAQKKLTVYVQTGNGPLFVRLNLLEQRFTMVFEENKDWLHAFISSLRWHEPDLTRVSLIVQRWAEHIHNKPLVFGKAVLQLLSMKDTKATTMLLKNCALYVEKASLSSSFVVLDVASRLNDLAMAALSQVSPYVYTLISSVIYIISYQTVKPI